LSYAATLIRQKLRALEAQPPGEAIPSPCNSVCRMDERSGFCEGCFRNLDEIAAWSGLDDATKREVWRRLGERAGVRPDTKKERQP